MFSNTPEFTQLVNTTALLQALAEKTRVAVAPESMVDWLARTGWAKDLRRQPDLCEHTSAFCGNWHAENS
jgi:hypothetical protein